LQDKAQKEKIGNLAFRVRMGEYEVAIEGAREEVLKTIEDLPRLITNVHKAFEVVKPKTVATLTVKTEAARQETKAQNYPKVTASENCDEAILRTLGTDWGKWRPRTQEELREVLKANGMSFQGRMLPNVLAELVRSGKVKRWNTDAGFVYILAEKETLGVKGEVQ
jgi:hypothetical protein